MFADDSTELENPSAELRLEELPCVFAPGLTLEQAVEALCGHAVELVRNGARLLLLTDRAAGAGQLPIPMAMATGAVHQALVQAGLRTLTGVAVEAGDCRDIHHAAVLIGYGAGAVCPWLALETARSFVGEKAWPEGVTAEDAEKLMLKSLDAGLAKVMSKMGISVVDSYRGAHLFDALGLNREVIDTCFFGTPAPLGGIRSGGRRAAALRIICRKPCPTRPRRTGTTGASWRSRCGSGRPPWRRRCSRSPASRTTRWWRRSARS